MNQHMTMAAPHTVKTSHRALSSIDCFQWTNNWEKRRNTTSFVSTCDNILLVDFKDVFLSAETCELRNQI